MAKLAGVHLEEQAREKAKRYAPPPSPDPVSGGLAGALITSVVLLVNTALVGGWEYPIIEGVILVSGFLLPFAYLKSQERSYHRACANELAKLRRTSDSLG